MSTRPKATDFFVAGGTLDPNSPSYVKRPADDDLFELAVDGEFCYVLTPRQMGKSSLMVRTAHRLQAEGVHTAIIDLTTVGTIEADTWYLDLLSELTDELALSVDVEVWWQAHASHGQVHRFVNFLRNVVLAEITGQVVIFIDEIDTTLSLDFRDDFFAAIRATYNARPRALAFNRLSFVLVGVATPSDLISDQARTPFNIGQGITLEEFSREDAAVLQEGLEAVCPGQSESIFTRIYRWTNGHPYLTQKLCLAVAENKWPRYTNERVDGLVEELFLTDKARKESNLEFVQRNILDCPWRDQLLKLYGAVLRKGKAGLDDNGQSPIYNRLKLSGIVKAENGHLRVRNEIYRFVFDQAWIEDHLSVNWTPILVVTTIISVLVALAVFGLSQYNASVARRVDNLADDFVLADTSEEKLTILAKVFRSDELLSPTDYGHRARSLFGNLPREEQLALFDDVDISSVPGSDLIEVVNGLYTALADVDGTGSTIPLLEAMARAIDPLDEVEEAIRVQEEINHWLQGRELARNGLYDDALIEFKRAIELNAQNPATAYERARILIELSAYEQALNDLDEVMRIAGGAQIPASSPPISPTASIVVSSTFVSVEESLGRTTATDVPSTPTPGTTASVVSGTPTSDASTTPTQVAGTSVPPTTPTPSLGSIEVPTPSPTPEPAPIVLGFVTFGQIAKAVGDLIFPNPGLVSALVQAVQASNSQYANLRESDLVITPVPDLCNGGLEAADDFTCWVTGGELEQSVQSETVYEGRHAALLGNPDYPCDGGVPLGKAWMYQAFPVPSCPTPVLSFKYQVSSYDVLGNDKWDSFDVYIDDTLVLRDGNTSERQVGCDSGPWDSDWVDFLYDLSPYSGQDILLSFHNVSRADHWYNTWTYIDQIEVSCQATPPILDSRATAIQGSSIFVAPKSDSEVLVTIAVGEQVQVLGRSAYGQWLYVQDDQSVQGFVYAPRFEWTGYYESLPVIVSVVTPAPFTPPAGPPYASLEMDLWDVGEGWCSEEYWYKQVYIRGQGGNGTYIYYWNGEKVAGPLVNEDYTFEVQSIGGGAIIGTGRVVSGDGQEAESELFIPVPDCTASTQVSTLTPSPTPHPIIYPAPTLRRPPNGNLFEKPTGVELGWDWNYQEQLGENEYFAVRVYPKGALVHHSETWTRATAYRVALYGEPEGDYCWHIVVLWGTSSDNWIQLSPKSEEWCFYAAWPSEPSEPSDINIDDIPPDDRS